MQEEGLSILREMCPHLIEGKTPARIGEASSANQCSQIKPAVKLHFEERAVCALVPPSSVLMIITIITINNFLCCYGRVADSFQMFLNVCDGVLLVLFIFSIIQTCLCCAPVGARKIFKMIFFGTQDLVFAFYRPFCRSSQFVGEHKFLFRTSAFGNIDP